MHNQLPCLGHSRRTHYATHENTRVLNPKASAKLPHVRSRGPRSKSPSRRRHGSLSPTRRSRHTYKEYTFGSEAYGSKTKRLQKNTMPMPKLIPVREFDDIVGMLKDTNLRRPWEDKRHENPKSPPSPDRRRKKKKKRKRKLPDGRAMWAEVKRKERENAAATKIQSQCRAFLARRHYKRHVNSALRIQTSWRRVTAKREVEGRRAERNRRSATAIQRNWRGKKARNQLKKQQEASLKIQANWRGKRGRDDLKRKHAASVKIQANWRGKRARKSLLHKRSSAGKIQRNWRGKKARNQLKKQQEASLKIQTNWRGKQARNQLRKQQEASLKIQTNWRGKQARDQMKREQAASLKIQTQWRCKSGRKSVREKRIAVRLQQWFDMGQHLFHRPIRGLIFDLENVVLDTKPVYWPACQAVCKKHNIECTEERFDKCAGFSPAHRYAALLGTMLSDEKVLPMVEEERELLIANKKKHQAEVGDSITLPWIAEISRATQVIRGDRTNLSVALVSSRSRADVELALQESGLLPNFTAIVTPDDVKNMQSTKDLYQAAATALDLDPIFCRGIAGSYRSLHAMEGAGIVSVDGQHPWRLTFSEDKLAAPILADRVTREVEMYTGLENFDEEESDQRCPMSPLMGMSRVYADAFAGSRFASIAEQNSSDVEPADAQRERAVSPLMGQSDVYAGAFAKTRFASIAKADFTGAEPVDAEPSDAAPPVLKSSPLRSKSKAFDNALASVTKDLEAGAEAKDTEAQPPTSAFSSSSSAFTVVSKETTEDVEPADAQRERAVSPLMRQSDVYAGAFAKTRFVTIPHLSLNANP